MTLQDENQITLAQLTTLSRGSHRHPGPSLHSTPYWWEALEASDYDTSDISLPVHTDVAIVGSGFTGLSAALTLARRGRSVVVLDADRLGFGASTRNGSQVGSGNQKFRVRKLIELFGEQKAVALLREGASMLDYIESLINREKIDCHFKRHGRFRGAIKPNHYEEMARDMDDLRHYTGIETFSVPKSEQHREIATDFFYGGSVLPDDAGLHPGLFHKGLLTKLRESGCILKGMSPVTNIEPVAGGFNVMSAGQKLRASEVIVATNGYTRKIHPYLNKRIVQIQSAVITTAPISQERLKELMPTERMYGNSARVLSYFRIAPSEPRIIWGGRVGRLHKPGSNAAYSHLARDLMKVFPDLHDVPVSHGWSGNIGYTFDDLPHLGKMPDGIHYAMGYCGTGVSRSIYFGHKIALKLLNDREGQTAFDDIALPSHLFHVFADTAVPMFEAWYRLCDRFNL